MRTERLAKSLSGTSSGVWATALTANQNQGPGSAAPKPRTRGAFLFQNRNSEIGHGKS